MADTYTLIGELVLPDRVVTDGALVVKDGIIAYAGRKKDAPEGASRSAMSWGPD